MSQASYPVTVSVVGPDGATQEVRIGTAFERDGGLSIRFFSMRIEAPGFVSVVRGGSDADSPGTATALPPGDPRPSHLQDLQYYAERARKLLSDPTKAAWHARERAILAQIEAELERQRPHAAGRN